MKSSCPIAGQRERNLITETYRGKPLGDHSFMGYQVRLKNPSAVETAVVESRICPICREIMYRAVTICGDDRHRQCQSCADDYLTEHEQPTECLFRCPLPTAGPIERKEIRVDDCPVGILGTRCPYHKECREVVTLEQIQNFEEKRRSVQVPHPYENLSKDLIKTLALDFHWEDQGLDFSSGTPENVPEPDDNHLNCCPYRPVVCRACEAIVPKKDYLSIHRQPGQCPKVKENCVDCGEGIFDGESSFHYERCFSKTMADSPMATDMTRLQENLAFGVELVGKQSEWQRKLTAQLVKDRLNVVRLESNKQKLTTELGQIKNYRGEREQLINKLQVDKYRLEIKAAVLPKRFAVAAFQSACEVIKAGFNEQKKVSKKDAATLGRIKNDIRTVDSFKAQDYLLAGEGFNFLGSRDHSNETFIHVHNAAALGPRGKRGSSSWKKLCNACVVIDVYRDKDTINVAWGWHKDGSQGVGEAPEGVVKVDAFCTDSRSNVSSSTKFCSDNPQTRIGAEGQSQKLNVVTIPVPPAESSGAEADSEPMDIVIRLRLENFTTPASKKGSPVQVKASKK